MTADQFTDVYHLLESEAPVFFTALDLSGASRSEPSTPSSTSARASLRARGDEDHTQNLAALIRRARNEAEASVITGA